MNLNDVYAIAEKKRVAIFSFGMMAAESLSYEDDSGDCYIAVAPKLLRSEKEEKIKVTHELGHCVTGAFYSQHTPLVTREICEARATHWSIRQLVPYDDLLQLIKRGIHEPWELAEHFDVPEDFMRDAIDYYQDRIELQRDTDYYLQENALQRQSCRRA